MFFCAKRALCKIFPDSLDCCLFFSRNIITYHNTCLLMEVETEIQLNVANMADLLLRGKYCWRLLSWDTTSLLAPISHLFLSFILSLSLQSWASKYKLIQFWILSILKKKRKRERAKPVIPFNKIKTLQHEKKCIYLHNSLFFFKLRIRCFIKPRIAF